MPCHVRYGQPLNPQCTGSARSTPPKQQDPGMRVDAPRPNSVCSIKGRIDNQRKHNWTREQLTRWAAEGERRANGSNIYICLTGHAALNLYVVYSSATGASNQASSNGAVHPKQECAPDRK